jgi:hypothetical protein
MKEVFTNLEKRKRLPLESNFSHGNVMIDTPFGARIFYKKPELHVYGKPTSSH